MNVVLPLNSTIKMWGGQEEIINKTINKINNKISIDKYYDTIVQLVL